MCSRQDSEDGSVECMEAKSKSAWTTVCQKCSSEKPVIQILQIKHAYCKNCFLAHVNHKFRSTLGKSRMMRPSDVVLAAYSGSVKSSVLLHLLQAGFSEKSHKRFLFKAKVLYIDEGAVLRLSFPERCANLKSIAQLAKAFGFSAYFTTLASVYDVEGPKCSVLNEESTLMFEETLENDLKNMFDNISSLTAKEDLLNRLRKVLLLQSAKELGCGKIFTASTSSDLAINILTDVSLGRGSQMHHDVSFCDGRDESVKILRPLLELSSKEVAFYSVYNSLNSVFIPSFCTKTAFDSSIHNLAKQFVMDLTENFPSTVSTVFRTGEKLGSSSNSTLSAEDNTCVLCLVSLDPNPASCSSVQATEFSRVISSLGPCGFNNKTLKPLLRTEGGLKPSSEEPEGQKPCCSVSSASCKNKSEIALSFSEIEAYCCYGCRRILYDMRAVSSLPEHVINLMRKRKSLQEMRESIEDFLL